MFHALIIEEAGRRWEAEVKIQSCDLQQGTEIFPTVFVGGVG